MKQTILILTVLLTAVAALGQSLQNQKACYVQAQKVVSKDPATHMSNHFDARTHTCWVKEYREVNGAIHESVYNAFEPNVWEAEFAGNTTPKDASNICWVGDNKCSNIAEFEKLAKKQYGF
jgi:hypothetical protein